MGDTMEIAHWKQQKHLVAKSLMINKLISFTFHSKPRGETTAAKVNFLTIV